MGCPFVRLKVPLLLVESRGFTANISQLKHNPGNSHVWNDLLKVKHLYLKGRLMLVGEGKQTDFWCDQWCGAVSLKDKFLHLFEICNEQETTCLALRLKTSSSRGCGRKAAYFL